MRATLALVVLAVAPAGAVPSRTIHFGIIFHANQGENTPYVASAKEFKRELEAATEGALNVEIVDIRRLGRERKGRTLEALSRLERGEFEMLDVQGMLVAERYDRRLDLFDVPFAIADYAHAERIVDGPIGRELLAGLSVKGVRGLEFTYSGGFRVVASRRPLRSAGDLQALKVVAHGRSAVQAWRAWGALPVPQPIERAVSLAETGAVDAVETTYNHLATSKLFNVLPHVAELDHNFLVTVMLANEAFLASLPESQRTALLGAARKAAAFERAETIRSNAELREAFLRRGVRVEPMPDPERETLTSAGEEVRSFFSREVDPDLLGRVLAERPAPPPQPARAPSAGPAR